ncbi:MAG: signal peptidase II [Bacteroidetes bacterium QS_9_68_14]|nr:MAG: signal peptidase II [Bacteroidetes bacterium QS_9_68_14]
MRILWISVLIVVLDQATKIAVVRTMHRGESIPVVGDWLQFTFTENPGMAFGMQLFTRESMAVLAIVVTVLLFWYLFTVRGGYTPYLASLALVFGGAVGNVIDRTFYGLILGYGDFLQGKVVDFIHVDAWRGYLPEALPLVGGAYLPLFPIWNVADMSIVVGVVGLLVFQRRFHELAFEEPKRDRKRLRELEKEREEAQNAPGGGAEPVSGPASEPGTTATQASPASDDVPPRAPSAENTGPAAAEAAAESEGNGTPGEAFAPPEESAASAESSEPSADDKAAGNDRSPSAEDSPSAEEEERA